MGVLNVRSKMIHRAWDLWLIKSQMDCDGELASTADLEHGHSFINHEDRGMMMNINKSEHVQNTWGIEPRCQVYKRTTDMLLALVMLSALRTSRSGQLEAWNTRSGYQPENCRLMPSFFDDYHSPLRSRFYRSGGTTKQIASDLSTIAHVC